MGDAAGKRRGRRGGHPGAGERVAAGAAVPDRAARCANAGGRRIRRRSRSRAPAGAGRDHHHDADIGRSLRRFGALNTATFAVVLMDVQMPVMGGFEATSVIREAEKGTTKRLRIVAMTAHAMTGDRARCLAAGMDGYLPKPIDPAALFAAVEKG